MIQESAGDRPSCCGPAEVALRTPGLDSVTTLDDAGFFDASTVVVLQQLTTTIQQTVLR